MKVQFLGTGAAEGIPGMYCHCPVCQEIRKRGAAEYHTRSQVLIDDALSIDFPPDAYYRSLTLGVDLEKIKTLLVTHSHMDHFYAHDFILRGYKYTTTLNTALDIYGNEEVKTVFEECTRREMKPEVAPWTKLHVIQPFQPFSVDGGYTVTALNAQHSKTEKAYVYLIEKEEKSYLHLTDTGRLPLDTLNYLQQYCTKQNKRVQLVTFDCTFLFREAGEVSRHMGLEDNRAMKLAFEQRNITNEHTRYVITHFSHNGNPVKETLEKAEKEYSFQPAFDGMTIEI